MKITNKEAYQLMVKYSGDNGISILKTLVQAIGIENTTDLITESYTEKGVNVPEEFKDWMRQGLNYLTTLNK
jgi:hypothetical protein